MNTRCKKSSLLGSWKKKFSKKQKNEQIEKTVVVFHVKTKAMKARWSLSFTIVVEAGGGVVGVCVLISLLSRLIKVISLLSRLIKVREGQG